MATLIPGAPEAFARGTLDQTTLPGTPGGLVVSETGEMAQTFTAGRTGFLDTVALSLDPSNADGRYTVEVVRTDASGVPTGAPLASRTIDACRVAPGPFEIAFGPAASITAGTRYATVVAYQPGSISPNNPSPPQLTWGSGNSYTNGAAFAAIPPAPNPAWGPAALEDLGFTTYVSATAPPTLGRDATQTTVTSASNPAPPGDVTFTATVTDPAHPGRVPTGTVAFRTESNGGTFNAPVDAQGHASQTFTLLNGTTPITAAYCPDTDRLESSSGAMDQTIEQDGTAMTLVAAPQTIKVGETTTITATVKDTTVPNKTPTGTVQFKDDFGQPIGVPVALQSGSASLATSALPAGTRLIFATYTSSDGFFGASSETVQVTVNRWASATAVSVRPAQPVAGQPTTFDATVTGSASDGHHPTGDVQFVIGSSPIGPPTSLDSAGHASLLAAGPAGAYQLHANYGGDNYFAAGDGAVPLTVGRADTTTTISSTPNPVGIGGEFAIDVDVGVVPPGNVGLDGPLQFFIDGQPDGPPIDLAGFTGVTVTADAGDIAGDATITARYLGGRNTNASSASLVQTVTAPAAQASVGGGSASPTSAPGSSSGPAAAPNAPDAGAALAALTDALRKAVGARGLRALNGLTETFAAPAAGRLVQQVDSPTAPKGAMPARAASRLLAAGQASFAAAGPGKVKLKLTAAGRRALRRNRTIKLAVVTRFIPAVGSATQRQDRFSARRATRSRRTAAKLVIPRWAWRPAAWALPHRGGHGR